VFLKLFGTFGKWHLINGIHKMILYLSGN